MARIRGEKHRPAGQPLEELLQVLLGEVAGPSSRDDIVLLAVQVPAG